MTKKKCDQTLRLRLSSPCVKIIYVCMTKTKTKKNTIKNLGTRSSPCTKKKNNFGPVQNLTIGKIGKQTRKQANSHK